MQKYNPEVMLSSNLQSVDPRIANLADKLQHIHQVQITNNFQNQNNCFVLFCYDLRWLCLLWEL